MTQFNFALLDNRGIGGYLSTLTQLQDKPFSSLKKKLVKAKKDIKSEGDGY